MSWQKRIPGSDIANCGRRVLVSITERWLKGAAAPYASAGSSTYCGPVASRCKPSDAWAAVEVPTKGVDFPEAEVGHERCMVGVGERETCLHIQAEGFADDRLA